MQVAERKKAGGGGSHPLLLPEVISGVLQFTAWREVYRTAAVHRAWTKVVNARALWSGANGLLWRADTQEPQFVKDWNFADRKDRGRSYMLQPAKDRWEHQQIVKRAQEKARRDREWLDWVWLPLSRCSLVVARPPAPDITPLFALCDFFACALVSCFFPLYCSFPCPSHPSGRCVSGVCVVCRT